MNPFRTPPTSETRRVARPRRLVTLATVGAALAMVFGASVPASATVDPGPSPTDPSPSPTAPSPSPTAPAPSPTAPAPISYWGGGDNVSVANYLNDRGAVIATVTGVWEVLGYPAPGEAGTVTVRADYSTWAVNDYALWHAPNKTSSVVGIQTAGHMYEGRNLPPAEHLFTGYSRTGEWREGRDYAWIKFQVDETWDRQVSVQGTGNWHGPDTGKIAPPVETGPDGITVKVLSMEETIYDSTVAYTVEVTVDPAVVGAPAGARYQVDTWPNGHLFRQTIPAGGGSVTFTGQVTGVTEENAAFSFAVWAVDAYGSTIYELTERKVPLGYVNTPAEASLSLDQWNEDSAGVWWQATINTRSLAGAAGEVCAYESSPCRATVYAVTDTGQIYTMKNNITVLQRRGDWTTTVTNIGGTALPKRNYTEVFVRITGSSVYGVTETLDSLPVQLWDGVTVTVLDIDETVMDEQLHYDVRVDVDPSAMRVPGAVYRLGVEPNGLNGFLREVVVPPEGGTFDFSGTVTDVTEDNAQVEVTLVTGSQVFPTVVADKVVDLGYVNTPAEVRLTVNEWFKDEAGIRWRATVDTRSLWGAAGEVCANKDAACTVGIYVVSDTGQVFYLKDGIAVKPRGESSGTFDNFALGGDALIDIGYSEMFARVHGSSSPGVSNTLDSLPALLAFDHRTWLARWFPQSSEDPEAWSQRTYVALGDSFQSGEGTDQGEPGQDDNYVGTTDNYYPGEVNNFCHRSWKAYPALLTGRNLFGGLDFEFWACKGAVTLNLWQSAVPMEGLDSPPWDDPQRSVWDSKPDAAGKASPKSAIQRVDDRTAVVTLGIGGNDVRFPDTMSSCISHSVGDFLDTGMRNWTCEVHLGADVDRSIRELDEQARIRAIIGKIHERAPETQIYVVGYPRFFSDDLAKRCDFIRGSDRLWMNAEVARLNAVVRRSAEAEGAQYIDIYDVGDGVELCSSEDSANWFMNGISSSGGSFHPNNLGHELIAGAVADQITTPTSGWTGMIHQDETLHTGIPVNAPTVFSMSVRYPGSDVKITAISPSGEVFDRDSGQANVSEVKGATWETLEITDPEVGEWTIELTGVEISQGGETFQFQSTVEPLPNEKPVAVATLEQHGATVTVSGVNSYDPDGEIVETGFDFGDGTVVYGDTATHVYDARGEVQISMWVKDDQGEYAFADVGTVIEIPEYTFSGFTTFMSHQPVKDWALAGHPIYLGFQLGQDWGDDVMMPGSPTVQKVSCTTGEAIGGSQPALGQGGMVPFFSAWTGEYSWVWDTEGSWTRTCQKLTFDFNDGSSASIAVNFNPPGNGSGKPGKDDVGGGPPLTKVK